MELQGLRGGRRDRGDLEMAVAADRARHDKS
jgi:hypothetical protein